MLMSIEQKSSVIDMIARQMNKRLKNNLSNTCRLRSTEKKGAKEKTIFYHLVDTNDFPELCEKHLTISSEF